MLSNSILIDLLVILSNSKYINTHFNDKNEQGELFLDNFLVEKKIIFSKYLIVKLACH